jgi:membrane protein required for colicin V production
VNWLDYLLAAIILVTTILGIIRGLVKQVIGLAAVVAGLILASLYYKNVSGMFGSILHSELATHFLSFLLIFVIVLVAGSLLAWIVTKAMKGPLALVNRVLGGAFGFLKSILICGILVFAMTTFKVGSPALRESALAPVCFALTRAVVNLIPQDLRAKFDSSYKEIRKRGEKHGEKI